MKPTTTYISKLKRAALAVVLFAHAATGVLVAQQPDKAIPPAPKQLLGHRYLTFNTEICVNQIEATRTTNKGFDVRKDHTPERVKAFREALDKGFPGARMTWGISWKALHDTSENYKKIRELIVSYHHQYGDDITLMPHSYFANVFNSIEQVNKDFHEGLKKISEMVGGGFRPKSVIAGFMAAPNLEYLANVEKIHVCQGNIWSQFSIDEQDGDGSVVYPYYPSKEHFCKPAQGKDDFIDCVNLDGWTLDFLAARRNGFTGGGNSRLGVGPIETVLFQGKDRGFRQMMYTTALHFDKNFERNGFAWVTSNWELFLPVDVAHLTRWMAEVKKRWPDTKVITQGEFGLLWREHFKTNSFDYQFVQSGGTGIAGSDKKKEIRWFMNKNFRLALLRDLKEGAQEQVIDFTRYDVKATEPTGNTRSWSLLGEINQKRTRPQDKPRPLSELAPEHLKLIKEIYPELTKEQPK